MPQLVFCAQVMNIIPMKDRRSAYHVEVTLSRMKEV